MGFTFLHASSAVILLHGIQGTSKDMSNITDTLHARGYKTFNLNYPSTSYRIEELSDNFLGPQFLDIATRNDTIHFVAHSMGAIIIRYFLQRHPDFLAGKIVMIGPPNNGSELTEAFHDLKFYQKRYGPAGAQIGLEMETELKLPHTLPPNTGIIAGTRTMFFVFSWILPGEDDGKVTHKNMKLDGYSDFITVPYHHDQITYKKKVCNLVHKFIKTGKF